MEKPKRKTPRPKTTAIRIETDGSNVTEVHPADRDLRVDIGQKPRQKGLWASLTADIDDLGIDD